MSWWSRSHRLARVSAALGQARRAERETPFALADPGAEPRVTFERLDVAVPFVDRLVELFQGDILAPAGECFHDASALRTRSVTRRFRRLSPWRGPRAAVSAPARS